MTVRYKDGVIIPPLHPAIEHALNIVTIVWKGVGAVPTVTSVGEGVHSSTSLHYGVTGDVRARAVDLRTRDLSSSEINDVMRELDRLLGEAYDVIDEGSHIHVELDPR